MCARCSADSRQNARNLTRMCARCSADSLRSCFSRPRSSTSQIKHERSESCDKGAAAILGRSSGLCAASQTRFTRVFRACAPAKIDTADSRASRSWFACTLLFGAPSLPNSSEATAMHSRLRCPLFCVRDVTWSFALITLIRRLALIKSLGGFVFYSRYLPYLGTISLQDLVCRSLAASSCCRRFRSTTAHSSGAPRAT
jgi:hypothetical protein